MIVLYHSHGDKEVELTPHDLNQIDLFEQSVEAKSEWFDNDVFQRDIIALPSTELQSDAAIDSECQGPSTD